LIDFEERRKPEILLRFLVTVGYTINLQLKEDYIDFITKSAEVISVSFQQNSLYPLEREDIGRQLIKEAIGLLKNQRVFGSGFQVGYRVNPLLLMKNNYFIIFDKELA